MFKYNFNFTGIIFSLNLRHAMVISFRPFVFGSLSVYIRIADIDLNGKYLKLRCANLYFKSLLVRFILMGDTRKIFVSNIKTVDESNSARVLIGCKPIIHNKVYIYI